MKCRICSSSFNISDRIPLILPLCLHTFCRSCIDAGIVNEIFCCPLDGTSQELPNGPSLLPLNKKIYLRISQVEKPEVNEQELYAPPDHRRISKDSSSNIRTSTEPPNPLSIQNTNEAMISCLRDRLMAFGFPSQLVAPRSMSELLTYHLNEVFREVRLKFEAKYEEVKSKIKNTIFGPLQIYEKLTKAAMRSICLDQEESFREMRSIFSTCCSSLEYLESRNNLLGEEYEAVAHSLDNLDKKVKEIESLFKPFGDTVNEVKKTTLDLNVNFEQLLSSIEVFPGTRLSVMTKSSSFSIISIKGQNHNYGIQNTKSISQQEKSGMLSENQTLLLKPINSYPYEYNLPQKMNKSNRNSETQKRSQRDSEKSLTEDLKAQGARHLLSFNSTTPVGSNPCIKIKGQQIITHSSKSISSRSRSKPFTQIKDELAQRSNRIIEISQKVISGYRKHSSLRAPVSLNSFLRPGKTSIPSSSVLEFGKNNLSRQNFLSKVKKYLSDKSQPKKITFSLCSFEFDAFRTLNDFFKKKLPWRINIEVIDNKPQYKEIDSLIEILDTKNVNVKFVDDPKI